MTELLFIIPICVFGFLLYAQGRSHAAELERRDKREDTLLNRIQAPEVAIAQSAPDPSPEALYLPMDDDAAHDAYVESRSNGEVS
jgi:hypothetical protein